jgi:hypothetical protein
MVMDQDGDMDMDPAPAASGMGQTLGNGQVYDDRGFEPRYDYEYGMSGSGGIGFGPGAEEDEEFMEETMGKNRKSRSASIYGAMRGYLCIG